ncbi:MAG: hypothetical protein RMJ17_02565 [Candidatus Aenigmarchaeota archaeon]|nr:hypothetical protein [Candidatus Aenigmarchaeota archaeon]MDW8149455.1 hypothetical protein [Candidatus Aenigmarchaeota archaeon]
MVYRLFYELYNKQIERDINRSLFNDFLNDYFGYVGTTLGKEEKKKIREDLKGFKFYSLIDSLWKEKYTEKYLLSWIEERMQRYELYFRRIPYSLLKEHLVEVFGEQKRKYFLFFLGDYSVLKNEVFKYIDREVDELKFDPSSRSISFFKYDVDNISPPSVLLYFLEFKTIKKVKEILLYFLDVLRFLLSKNELQDFSKWKQVQDNTEKLLNLFPNEDKYQDQTYYDYVRSMNYNEEISFRKRIINKMVLRTFIGSLKEWVSELWSRGYSEEPVIYNPFNPPLFPHDSYFSGEFADYRSFFDINYVNYLPALLGLYLQKLDKNISNVNKGDFHKNKFRMLENAKIAISSEIATVWANYFYSYAKKFFSNSIVRETLEWIFEHADIPLYLLDKPARSWKQDLAELGPVLLDHLLNVPSGLRIPYTFDKPLVVKFRKIANKISSLVSLGMFDKKFSDLMDKISENFIEKGGLGKTFDSNDPLWKKLQAILILREDRIIM